MSEYKVFDIFYDAILVFDEDLNVWYGNESASILFDLSTRRMASGRPISQLIAFDPDPLATFTRTTSLEILDGPTQVKEVKFTTNDGKEGGAQLSVQPEPPHFKSGERDKRRFIMSIRDVSLEMILHKKYRGELDQKEAVIRDLEVAREKLQDYSRNLEKMVEARTAELREANQLLKTILDSLGQGILVFDKNGNCLPIFSQICKQMFGVEPAGTRIEQVLRLSEAEGKSFSDWREAVYSEMLDFSDLRPLAPSQFNHAGQQEIFLDYNEMRGSKGIDGVVVVATDRTAEMQATREAEKERALVRRIVQVARNREAFRLFVADSTALLAEMSSGGATDREEISRRLHTLKGGAATFALLPIVEQCHHLEGQLLAVTDDHLASFVSTTLISEAHELTAELDKELAEIAELLGPLGGPAVAVIEVPADRFASWTERLMATLSIEEARLIGREILTQCSEKPLGDYVRQYDGALAELATRLGKRLLPIQVDGGETRAVVKPLGPLLSSLVHAFRNALDHGIESPLERQAAGKPEQGLIKVSFARTDLAQRAELRLVIQDDGRGVNLAKVREKLVLLGKQELASATDDIVSQVILGGELSTADQVTDVSGRGVGLSAVADEVKKLGGKIHVTSQWGFGTTIEMSIPLPEIQNEAAAFGAASRKAA